MTDCIEVSTSRNVPGGYGRSRVNVGKDVSFTILAHRMAWELEHGPIPDGLLVLHHCDNKGCVNVEHLFLGTHSDNRQDLADKGLDPMSLRTHCPWGHEYSEENTTRSGGRRYCRACDRDRRYFKKKETK